MIRSFEAGEPAVMEVYKMTDGFATALQNMHPGDKWENLGSLATWIWRSGI